MANHIICCHNLSHRYDETPVIEGFELCVNEGEFVALLGRSGSGKTTLLRLIAGFERPTQGTIEIAGRLVAGNGVFIPPEKRRVGMVFQDYALFPHLTVEQNVAFGLGRKPAEDAHLRVRQLLATVGLHGQGDKYPHELSGAGSVGNQRRMHDEFDDAAGVRRFGMPHGWRYVQGLALAGSWSGDSTTRCFYGLIIHG